ncbi:sulfonate ABC transporter, periplamic sulfonate-binding protein [Roseobacter sp. GAI101]|nr:sulfonate ABC transporter, periplamic sulfonate-binding protein [Roseobacter sp. GAI101]
MSRSPTVLFHRSLAQNSTYVLREETMSLITRRQSLALLGAVSLSGLAAPAIAQSRKINVGALRFTSHAASFTALYRGYFEDVGLDVNLVFFDAAQPMAIAIASGDVDFGVTAVSGGLISLAQKGAVKVFGGAAKEEPGTSGQKILVSNAAYESGVRTPADLNGKRFGISQAGSSFHYMGSKIAATEGIDMQYTPLQSVGNIIGSLRSGQIDAWAIVPHIASQLTASGAAHEIAKVSDYLPDYQLTTLFTSPRLISEERALVEAFLAAFNLGVDDFNAALVDNTLGDDGRDSMVEIIHQHVYSDQPIKQATGPIIAGSMRLASGSCLGAASLRDQLDWFRSENLIDQDVTYETVIDDSFVPQC